MRLLGKASWFAALLVCILGRGATGLVIANETASFKLHLKFGTKASEDAHASFKMALTGASWAYYQQGARVSVCIAPGNAKEAKKAAAAASGLYIVTLTPVDDARRPFGALTVGTFPLKKIAEKHCFSMSPCEFWSSPFRAGSSVDRRVSELQLEIMYFEGSDPEIVADHEISGVVDVTASVDVQGSLEHRKGAKHAIRVPARSAAFVVGKDTACTALLGTGPHKVEQVYKQLVLEGSSKTRLICGEPGMDLSRVGQVILPVGEEDVSVTCSAAAV